MKPKRTREQIKQDKFLMQQRELEDAYYADELKMPPECDDLCRFRRCYHKSTNKGSYTICRGYTRYYDDFRPVCGTRHAHGCPSARRDNSNCDVVKALRFVRDSIESQLSTVKPTAADRKELRRRMRIARNICGMLADFEDKTDREVASQTANVDEFKRVEGRK